MQPNDVSIEPSHKWQQFLACSWPIAVVQVAKVSQGGRGPRQLSLMKISIRFFHTKGGFRSDSFPCHSSRTGNDGFVRFGNDARPTLSGPQRRTLRRHPEFRRVIRRRDASCSSPSSICCPLDVVSESLGCYSAFMNSWGIPTSHIRTTSTDDPLCPALKHIPVQ